MKTLGHRRFEPDIPNAHNIGLRLLLTQQDLHNGGSLNSVFETKFQFLIGRIQTRESTLFMKFLGISIFTHFHTNIQCFLKIQFRLVLKVLY